ncbi:putative metal-dependent HD superfamily phosphohydrolase [Lewinella aquimaris]|uniref:Putative metal-dependent HD superfamily phosphohydrolase n=1 Tax=Neolewinella aquimaris TaxID=1835722 RepID=A0A840EBQ0_9BACT|nr:Pycsar system effector family protein [Neolewinella aquimaris]MBB4078406.1 putative metal-dependent HD superfamily phosphohydrolase [Neolewinella aquimaris]
MDTVIIPADLLPQVKAHVERYIKEKIDPKFVYHNFQHTCAVVEAAGELATFYELTPRELTVIRIAAWFHDTGYAQGWPDHEVRSAENAEAFLREKGVDDEALITDIRGAIMATRIPQQPNTFLEEIVADADLSHLGEASYWDRCGRVRQEFALTRNAVMSDQEWIDFELAFMVDHEYHTEAARELFGERKEKHVRQLYKRKKALYPDQTPTTLEELERAKTKKKQFKKRKDDTAGKAGKAKDLRPGRGVETMFRATYRTHVNLSSIADNKANIMLSVNAIILSISAANLFPKLDSNPHLTAPTIILVGVCLVSLFYAIQATRPKVTEGEVSLEDIETKRSNLLFFGNFYNMKLADFHYGMMEMIRDEDFLYSTMTRDIYYLGVVLAKKYTYLRICYNVFLFGIIIAVLSFVAAAMYYNQQTEVNPGSSIFGF